MSTKTTKTTTIKTDSRNAPMYRAVRDHAGTRSAVQASQAINARQATVFKAQQVGISELPKV